MSLIVEGLRAKGHQRTVLRDGDISLAGERGVEKASKTASVVANSIDIVGSRSGEEVGTRLWMRNYIFLFRCEEDESLSVPIDAAIPRRKKIRKQTSFGSGPQVEDPKPRKTTSFAGWVRQLLVGYYEAPIVRKGYVLPPSGIVKCDLGDDRTLAIRHINKLILMVDNLGIGGNCSESYWMRWTDERATWRYGATSTTRVRVEERQREQTYSEQQ